MKRIHSITAIALTGIMSFGVIAAPMAANASVEGKRNTAIGLGALEAALLLTQHNKVPGLIAAGGAVYAASQVNNNDRARYRYGDDGDYRKDWNNGRNDNSRNRWDGDNRQNTGFKSGQNDHRK